MKIGTKTIIYMGGVPVAECHPVSLPVSRKKSVKLNQLNLGAWELSAKDIRSFKHIETKMEYYRRRGNVFYFRNEIGFIKLTLSGDQLKSLTDSRLKYGDIVKMKWN